MKKKRLLEIDRLKGIAIILVVLGHVADRDSIYVEDWYMSLKVALYQFHMPLFMFLSGLAFFYTYSNFHTIKEYKLYIIKKSLRIIPPFIIFSIIIFLGKLLFSNFLYIENMSLENLFLTYTQLYIYPTDSFIGSYWYIYVLLEYLIIFPVLLSIFKQNIIPLLGIGVIMFFIPVSSMFAMNMFFRNFIFFTLGIYIMGHYKIYLELIKTNAKWFIILFLASFILVVYIPFDFSRLFIGFFSLFAFYAFVQSSLLNKSNLLVIIGKYSFVIYLMNTIFIGITKAFLIKYSSSFTLIFIISILSGIIMPIVFKKYIFSKLKYLDKITN